MSRYTKPLSDREQALEEAFFRKWNENLRAALREEKEHEERVRVLAGALGFRDEAVQDALVALGISPETLPAFALAPLVVVAWASGEVTPEERTAVLAAAHEEGIERGSPAYGLLDAWLEKKPSDALLSTWLDYASAIEDHAVASHREWLRNEMSRRARAIARASGGIAKLGAISASEQAVIDAIEDVL